MTHPRARFVLVALALLALAPPAGADIGNTPLTGWRFSNGDISAAQRRGRVLYVGGRFDAVAPAANDDGAFVVLGPAGTPVRRGPQLGGAGNAVADDGAGGYFIARAVPTSVPGVDTHLVTRLLADGSPAPGAQHVFNLDVAVVRRIGGTLFVGGSFTAVDGQARGGGAAFDVATGALLPWNPRVDANGSIRDISDGGSGRVYIGGNFTTVGGTAAASLVRVSAATGAVDSVVGTGLTAGGVVSSLLTANGLLYVGGLFTKIAASPRQNLAAIDLSTQAVTAFVANSDRSISSLSRQGSVLYLAGGFTAVNGIARTGLAQVDAVTGAVTPWQAILDAPATALQAVGTTLFASGFFTTVNGERRPHLAALDISGTVPRVLPWNPALVDSPQTLTANANGEVAVSGFELAHGARVRDGIAAFDLVTNELLPFAPLLDVPLVTGLEISGTTVYLYGDFSTVNGAPRAKLAAVDLEGRLLPWNPGTSSTARPFTMAVAGGTVIVGGLFTQLGGQARSNLGAVDAVTGNATALRLDTDGAVVSLELAGTTLYASGVFTVAKGLARVRLAAFDITSGAVLPFAPDTNNTPLDMHASGPLLYMTGPFTSVGGASRTYAAAVDRVTGALAPFAPALDFPPDRVVERNGVVYFAGGFTSVNGVPRAGQGAVAPGPGNVTLPFNPALGDRRWSVLEARPDMLIGAAANGRGALFFWPDAPPSGIPAPPSAPTARVTGAMLSVSWERSPLGPTPASYVLEAATSPGGPAMGSVPVTSTSFSVGGVPPGLYFLRVRAVAAGGSSGTSPEVGVVVGALNCVESPGRPELTALAGAGSVALQWDAEPGATSTYTLIAGTGRGASNLGTAPMGRATSFTGPAPPGVYYARVQATNACGVSVPSIDAALVVDTAAPPVSPVLSATVTGATVTLSWTASPGATSYRVEAGTGPLLRNLGVVTVAGTTLTAPNVPPGTYFLRVVAIGPTGESALPDETTLVVR